MYSCAITLLIQLSHSALTDGMEISKVWPPGHLYIGVTPQTLYWSVFQFYCPTPLALLNIRSLANKSFLVIIKLMNYR